MQITRIDRDNTFSIITQTPGGRAAPQGRAAKSQRLREFLEKN
jgi:hypothetical protein